MRVAAAARAHGKAAAFMPADRAWIDRVQALGYTMVGVGTDHGLLGSAVEQMVTDVMAVDGNPRATINRKAIVGNSNDR